MAENKSLTCVDCFCGAGGLSLGLLKAGIKVIYSFDLDPICSKTHYLNNKYFNFDTETNDVSSMRNGVLLKKISMQPGELDILAGGPPCQGFSVQRIGPDKDIRNNLIQEYMLLVEEVSPKFFIMENVPGIKGKRGREYLSKALEHAESIGYFIHSTTIDAQLFKVPQRRKRVFIVGEKKRDDQPLFSFPEPTVKNNKDLVTVKKAIGHLPEPPQDGKEHPSIPNHRRDRLSPLNKERLKALKPGQGRDALPVELLSPCHLNDSSKIGHRNVYGRMAWDEVAPTITARFDSFTRGKFGHPEQIRSISLHEGALLQTFPSDFVFAGSKVEVARQIGNAVPPLLAKKLGLQLIKACGTGKQNGLPTDSKRVFKSFTK